MGMDQYHLHQQKIERLGRMLLSDQSKLHAQGVVAGMLREAEVEGEDELALNIVDALWQAWEI